MSSKDKAPTWTKIPTAADYEYGIYDYGIEDEISELKPGYYLVGSNINNCRAVHHKTYEVLDKIAGKLVHLPTGAYPTLMPGESIFDNDERWHKSKTSIIVNKKVYSARLEPEHLEHFTFVSEQEPDEEIARALYEE